MEKAEMQDRVKKAMLTISAALGLLAIGEDEQAMRLIGRALAELAPVCDDDEVVKDSIKKV